jgi:hypothetical protein
VSHRGRILRIVNPRTENGGPRPRSVLEGLARTDRDKRAASALIDYLVALGELVVIGHARGAVYGLPKGRGR